MVKNIFKAPAMYMLKQLDLYSLFMLRKAGPLKENGWFRSFREKAPIDADGNPLPWLTYPAIEFLKKRVRREMSVFEYGCGASTLWWAMRVREVISVEHDKDWYERISSSLPGNVILCHVPLNYGGVYAAKIAEHEKRFNVIVLDGRDRINCAMNCLKSLKDDGVIIWDNSDRKEYEEGFRFLFAHDFRKIEFIGFAPGNIDTTETAIFYRPGNCLEI
jgi:hypothetical protein